ncbi:MAG: OadG family protein [Clostridiales bacterium]|jgi:sodium pump decarboxylase gamma subunit|nr:OadG family protein [Clostridiales bacterium]
MVEYSIWETILLSVLGIIAVFIVLAVLMLFIKVITFVSRVAGGKEKPATPAASDKLAAYAKGSCGDVKLHNVPDKDAAMIMAIVADKLKTPLNELRFISIKMIGE